jgi:hypothetical protein
MLVRGLESTGMENHGRRLSVASCRSRLHGATPGEGHGAPHARSRHARVMCATAGAVSGGQAAQRDAARPAQ